VSDPVPGPLFATLAVWSIPIAVLLIAAPGTGIGLALAPAPVAVAIAARRYPIAAALTIGFALFAAVGVRNGLGIFVGVLALSVALPIGMWSRRGMTYGPLVAGTSAVVGAALVVALASEATTVDESLQAAYKELEHRIEDMGDRIDAETSKQILSIQQMTVEHWPYLIPGVLVATTLFSVALATAFMQFLARRVGAPSAPGRFRDMRPPDWLVWTAIGCALLGFADRESSNNALRIVAWNGGIVLAGIYWLNGIGILVTAVERIRWPIVVLPLVALALLTPHMNAMLTVVGFFDTWIEFRARLARRGSNAPPDDPEGT
jgi:hypothetical protein